MEQHTYLVIDLKSFYASVECAERGLDPMTARLWWLTQNARRRPSVLPYPLP